MARHVALVRHAQAEAAESGSDHDRALTDQGRRAAAAAGRWLATHLATPDLVWCSSALRAGQTWQAMAGSVRPGEVRVDRALYLAAAGDVVSVVREDPLRTLVVVGHNPTMEHALALLAGTLRALPPGAVALVDPETRELVELWEPPR